VASPQIEQGYTKIANELLEALAKTNFSPYQRRVLDAIIRKTYGYNKKKDRIAGSQIVELTGIHKANVSRALKELRKREIVISTDNKLSVNKDYKQWQKLSVPITKKVINSARKVISTDYKKLSVETDTKERKKLTKEKNSKAALSHYKKVLDDLTTKEVDSYSKKLATHFKVNIHHVRVDLR